MLAISVFVIIIFGSILLLYLFQRRGGELLIEIIRNQGLKGQLIYVLYLVAAVVFSPLNSLVIKPVVLLSYGYWTAVILAFIGTTIGGTVNFFLAKKFGRPIISKLAGEKPLKKIDDMTNAIGNQTFLLFRIVGANYYDYLSYAAGLTSLRFSFFILVTVPTNFLWKMLIFYIIGKAIDFKDWRSIILLGGGWVISIVGGYFLWRKYKKRKKKI